MGDDDPRQIPLNFSDALLVGRAKRGKTHDTGNAMQLLHKRRHDLITKAREHARRLATQMGTVTTRDVRKAMAHAGELNDNDNEFWLGAVFRSRDFEWTGDWYEYADRKRNIHERRIKVWRLSKNRP